MYLSCILDVIDWILDNLIEKNRTRRGIIKKLKELGLIFRAPTKKSIADGISKHAWHHEQDKLLRELFDAHRLENGMHLLHITFTCMLLEYPIQFYYLFFLHF